MTIKPLLTATAALLLIGPTAFADSATASNAVAPTAAEPTVAQPTAAEPKDVPQVSIESFQNLPVCRRHVPTGSRIATRRCTTPEAEEGQRLAARQELDALRRQQMAEETARQAARQEALRRRGGF